MSWERKSSEKAVRIPLASYFASAYWWVTSLTPTRHIKPYVAENPISGNGYLAQFLNITHELLKYSTAKIE